MKRILVPALIFLLVMGICLLWNSEPEIEPGSQVTETASVTDRAMSDGLPYLGVTLPDGTVRCLWDVEGSAIPEDISVGDTVTVTYGYQPNSDRYVLLKVTK